MDRPQEPSSSQPFSSASITSALASTSTGTSFAAQFAESSARLETAPTAPSLAASGGPAAAAPAQRAAVRATLDRVLGAMNRFREACPLMGMIHDGFVTLQGAM